MGRLLSRKNEINVSDEAKEIIKQAAIIRNQKEERILGYIIARGLREIIKEEKFITDPILKGMLQRKISKLKIY